MFTNDGKKLYEGDIYPPNSALLYDRVKINSTKPQLIGNQERTNKKVY